VTQVFISQDILDTCSYNTFFVIIISEIVYPPYYVVFLHGIISSNCAKVNVLHISVSHAGSAIRSDSDISQYYIHFNGDEF